MKVLVIARHAKAEPPGSEDTDHARALEVRGRQDARTLGDELTEGGFVPQVALVSDANRAVQTWKLASQEWEDVDVHLLPSLYATTVDSMIRVIAEAPAGADRVMLVGHEPTVSATAANLAGKGSDKAALQRVALGLSTGTGAVLEFDGEWADAARGAMRLRGLIGRRGWHG